MKRVGVLIANGFEEAEALIVTDILRKGGVECDLVGESAQVTGSHDITLLCDAIIEDGFEDKYDMIVLPGGRPGADNLRDNEIVIKAIQTMEKKGRWVAAMCAAPIVLDRAGVLESRDYTAYVGFEKIIGSGNFKEDIVVVDKGIFTSRGPATTKAFALKLLDLLGGDAKLVESRGQKNTNSSKMEAKVDG